MYVSGATTEGSSFRGTGGSETNSYWILRKPCTKKVFDKAVEKANKN